MKKEKICRRNPKYPCNSNEIPLPSIRERTQESGHTYVNPRAMVSADIIPKGRWRPPVYRTPVSSRGRHRNPREGRQGWAEKKEKEKNSPSQRGEEGKGHVNGTALSERGSVTFIGKRDVDQEVVPWLGNVSVLSLRLCRGSR